EGRVTRPLWHMGALHPFEQVLVLLLAFGPFVVLGVVVWLRRREDAREDAREHSAEGAAEDSRGARG
ncbi:MAG: hypothetical protein ACKOVB_04435, partial [Terrabacter sp.]